MEEKQNSNKRIARVCLSVVASVLLANTAIGSMLYTVPLVLISYSFIDTKKAVLVQFASVLLTAILSFWLDFRGMFQQMNMGIILLSGYLLLIPGIFCMIYTALRNWSSSVLRRMVVSSIPVLVFGIMLVVWLSSPSGEIPLAGLRTMYGTVINQFPEIGNMFDLSELSFIVVFAILFMIVPLGLVCSSLSVLLAETAFHKLDEQWQSGFAFMKMPNHYAYVFIGLLLSSVISTVAKLPACVYLALWNATFWLAMHYLLNGMSLYFFWRRKENNYYLASRVVFSAILISLLPGISLFIFFGLFLLGFLETWIEFR